MTYSYTKYKTKYKISIFDQIFILVFLLLTVTIYYFTLFNPPTVH